VLFIFEPPEQEAIMDRSIRWYDYLTININYFALTTRSQVLTPLIIPLLVQQFVGEEVKGTYVGSMRLWALMAAVLIQALMGILSDRSTSRLGRRRLFIILGAIGESVIFIFIGLIIGFEGMRGYWILFSLYILSMVTSNTSHAATQGLIPDLVPDEKKGIFSGVKVLFELPIPLIFVSFILAKLISGSNLWGGLIGAVAVLIICMLITMLVPEKQLEKAPPPLDWKPFMRLVFMTAVFTSIILGVGALVKFGIQLSSSMNENTAMIFIGVFGLIGIAAAVALGVWLSIRISIGQEIHQNRSFTWWVVNRLAFLVGATNLAGFMIFFLQERFVEYAGEKAVGPAATIIMFVGIFILLTAVPSGWLADRFGKKILLVISGLLATIGTAIAITAPTLNILTIGAAIIGAGVGLFYSSNWALGTEIVPKDKAGQFLGLSNLAGAGAGAIGAYVGGPIADNMSFTLLMSLYGTLFLLSIFALLGVKEKR
jgi:MFS family permease